jgi:predicted XRE-type DNA-binding protein
MDKKIEVEESSGNVFADIGIPNPEEHLAKAKLAGRIISLLEKKKITQKQAAKLLQIDQPRISDLICGRLRRFSTEKLLYFLIALDQDIEIVVRPKGRTRKSASVRVVLAA